MLHYLSKYLFVAVLVRQGVSTEHDRCSTSACLDTTQAIGVHSPIDGSSLIQLPLAGTISKPPLIRLPLMEESPHALKRTEICAALKNRKFKFEDDVCGVMQYNTADMLQVFDIEQTYWAEQGVQNPWWAVLTGFEKGAEVPIDRQLEFFQTGKDDVDKMLPMAQAFGILKKEWIAKATALDFGCGLGRMSNALASVGFRKVICVDQARSFLDAGEESLTKLSGQGVVVADVSDRVKFLQSAPDLLCVQEASSIDFVHSIITLQHMKPMLQVAYVEQLCDVLSPGGAGYFQIPTFIKGTDLNTHCNLHSEGNIMMMHYTPEDEVRRHLSGRGCKVLSATEYNMIGKAGTSMLFIFEKL
mmetsp:Transcript_93135/g.178902  ORF Transcript_93135/g.178902 Transcript_93135/m.178902 type:complete len:358 (-) Transcript_93135:111-1184(-)